MLMMKIMLTIIVKVMNKMAKKKSFDLINKNQYLKIIKIK